MTNGVCIYRETIDSMSRMALWKDDFRRYSVIQELRVTGHRSRRASYVEGENIQLLPS